MPEMPDFSLSSFQEVAIELGTRLKALRLVQGLQQTELAARAGVTRYTVQEFERTGKCTMISFLRIVYALRRESELQDLFQIQVRSIVEMERAELPKRKRAPRKYSRKIAPSLGA